MEVKPHVQSVMVKQTLGANCAQGEALLIGQRISRIMNVTCPHWLAVSNRFPRGQRRLTYYNEITVESSASGGSAGETPYPPRL